MVDAYGKSAIYSLSFILCLLSIVSSLLRSIIPNSHCAFSSFPAILSFFFLFVHTYSRIPTLGETKYSIES